LWNDMGVLCFSEVWNDLQMWSLYADSGNGICLRLSCASLKAGLAPPDCPLPVQYSDRARAPWRVPDDEREDEEVVAESLLQKTLAWEYQREWRMLRHTGRYNALPPNALCGLIFGWHVTMEVRKEIADWIASGNRHMSLEEAVPSGDRLTLRAVRL